MKRFLLCLLLLLSAAAFAQQADVYLSQGGTLSNTGLDCASAHAITFFNNGSNWGSGGTQIGANTIVHLCGTFTVTAGTSNYLIFQAAGTSGSPITLLFEPGAVITSPYWSGPVINHGGESYTTVDGGTNGIIQATDNGTVGVAACIAGTGAGGTCGHSVDNGVCVANYGAATGLVDQNLTCANLYVDASLADNGGEDTYGFDIDQGTSVIIQNNTAHDMKWAIRNSYSTGTYTGLTVTANTAYNVDHGWFLTDSASGATASLTNVNVFGNNFTNFGNWDNTANLNHHDGLHISTNSTTSRFSLISLYNNFIGGEVGTNGNAGIFLSPASAAALTTVYVFNNVSVNQSTKQNCWANGSLGMTLTGTVLVAQNTFASTEASCINSNLGAGGANHGLIYENNSATLTAYGNIFNLLPGGAEQFHGISGGSTVAASDYNNFNGSLSWVGVTGTSYSTLATWQSGSGFDANSITGDPLLSSSFQLQTGSAAILAAESLIGLCRRGSVPGLGALCNDKNGNPRPASGNWDQGAYNYVSAPSSNIAPIQPEAWVDNNEAFDGSVTGYTITASGFGCIAGALIIDAPPMGGTQAAGTYGCVHSGFGSALFSVQITNPGSGYTSAPTATLTAGTGTLTLTIATAATYYELQLGASTASWVVGPPATCTFSALTTYVSTFAGLQAAVNDVEACRTLTGVAIIIDAPPGLYQASTLNGLLIPQTSTSVSGNFLVLRSTDYASLPDGTTVCSHDIGDNLPSAPTGTIGLNNPDCSGTNMYYELGPQSLPGDAGTGTGSHCVSYAISGTTITATLVSGAGCAATYPPSFTVGNIVMGASAKPTVYNANLQILSGGAGTTSLTATACSYTASPSCIGPTAITNATISSATSAQITVASNQFFNPTDAIVIAGITNASFTQLNGTWAVASTSGTTTINLTTSGLTTESSTALAAGTATIGPSTTSGNLNAQNVITGHTTLSANTTTLMAVTSAEVSNGICVLIPLANGYVAPGNAYVITGSDSHTETVTGAGCPNSPALTNQMGIFALFTATHVFGSTVKFCAAGCAYTLANGDSINTSNYNDFADLLQLQALGTGNSLNAAMTFCNASGTAQTPACATNIAPDHWVFEDIAANPYPGTCCSGPIFSLATDTALASTSQMSSHVHFRHNWFFGDYTSLATGANSVTTSVAFDCFGCSVGDSQVSQLLRPGGEGHGFTGGYGSVTKVYHNWVDGQSIGMLCGGFTYPQPPIAGLIPCNDLEVRNNRFTHPFAWLGQTPVPVPMNPNFTSSISLGRKNCWEMKESQRYIFVGNICENVDDSGAQGGPIIVLDGTNSSSGTNPGTNYQSVHSDGYLANNVMRNGCAVALVTAGGNGSMGGVALGGGREEFFNDLIYSITNTNPGCGGSTRVGMQLGSYSATWGTGTYGTLTRTGTIATFTAGCQGASPGGKNDCPNGSGSAPYVVRGMGQTDINVGDHVAVAGCTDTSFNTASGVIYGTYSGLLLGPKTLSGTAPNTLTVVYDTGQTGASSETSGLCRLYKIQGWPYGFQFLHSTVVSDKTGGVTSGADKTSGPNYAASNLFRDSIMVTGGGWQNTGSSIPEGTSTEKFNYDTGTLSNDHTVWPGRTAASYTEYGNNPSFPDSAGCTGAGCSPPTTMYFPSTVAGVGFNDSGAVCNGAVSAGGMTLPDYHCLSLTSLSSFSAGKSEDASDGTDMGPSVSAIDAALIANTYKCPYACGSPGPFPNVMGAPPPPSASDGIQVKQGVYFSNGIQVQP